jgi:alkylation response protein AidB-like acyl-CoA dehydrogenase
MAFPAVDAEADLELGSLICLKGLSLADAGLPHDREAAMAKMWVPPRMFAICHWALEVAGHAGYTHEHAAQLRLRDVLATEIGEGATNIQRLLLATQLFGVRPG